MSSSAGFGSKSVQLGPNLVDSRPNWETYVSHIWARLARIHRISVYRKTLCGTRSATLIEQRSVMRDACSNIFANSLGIQCITIRKTAKTGFLGRPPLDPHAMHCRDPTLTRDQTQARPTPNKNTTSCDDVKLNSLKNSPQIDICMIAPVP